MIPRKIAECFTNRGYARLRGWAAVQILDVKLP